MEKLERVLDAEENARQVVARAREEAAAIRNSGDTDARTIEAQARAESAELRARQRAEIVGAAKAVAARIAQDADARAEALRVRAAEKADAVTARVVASILE
jgi:vacuolar-type H+-ATPase subunit H